MRKLLADVSGVAALEFAIVAPIAIAMIGFGCDLWQTMDQKSSVAFTATACAAAGSATLRQAQDQNAATATAIAVATANAALFLPIATVDPPVITFQNGLMTVTIHANAPALWNMFIQSVDTTATATD